MERARGRQRLVAAAAPHERLGEVGADHRVGRGVGDAALALDRERQSEVLGGGVRDPRGERVMAATGVHAHQLIGQLQPFRELELMGERLVVEAALRRRDPGEDAEPPALVVRPPELAGEADGALAVGLRALPRARRPPKPGAADERVGERPGRRLLALVDELVERLGRRPDPLGERQRHSEIRAQLEVVLDGRRVRDVHGDGVDVALGGRGVAEEDERRRPGDARRGGRADRLPARARAPGRRRRRPPAAGRRGSTGRRTRCRASRRRGRRPPPGGGRLAGAASSPTRVELLRASIRPRTSSTRATSPGGGPSRSISARIASAAPRLAARLGRIRRGEQPAEPGLQARR